MRHLIAIAFDWGKRCFGEKHMKHAPTRALRIVEEAIELCQAAGVDRDTVADVLVNVYNRPRGFMAQEMGGVLVTAYLFCEMQGWEPEEIFVTELRRVLAKTSDHFAKRNAEKIDLSTETVNKGASISTGGGDDAALLDGALKEIANPNDLIKPPEYKSPLGIDA